MEPGHKWDKWKMNADSETKKMIKSVENGNSPIFKQNIWKKYKLFLNDLFHEKCAYCEGKYGAGFHLAVEHHRPKDKVTIDRSPAPLKVKDKKGREIEHPGYYWLTYDCDNLALSCNKCNGSSGKWNQFPISGKRACCPEDSLDEEKPLILNPYKDDPKKHIKFGKFGVVSGISEKGRKSVDVYNIDRKELCIRREEEWEKLKIKLLICLINDKGILIKDDMEFSSYLRETLNRYIHEDLPKELKIRI